MTYGSRLMHEKLESQFARFVGVEHAVAVGSGGMAIQVVLRALGVRPGDEISHQVDTCAANALAVLNAGGVPVFADSDIDTFGVFWRAVACEMNKNTRVLMPIHLWGNVEDLDAAIALSRTNGIPVVEDCCLGLGATYRGRSVGSYGVAAVYSFGCMKPVQAGEGGMIVTPDAALAREMRVIRNWGDRALEYGEKDVSVLSWNGRMAEIVAAVALEQLRGYPERLRGIRENVGVFLKHLERCAFVKPVQVESVLHNPCYTQLSLRFDPNEASFPVSEFVSQLRARGIGAGLANFDPIHRLSLFKTGGSWNQWVPAYLKERLARNYGAEFPNAGAIFQSIGFGLPRSCFENRHELKKLIHGWDHVKASLEKGCTSRL
jgi:dTDP-4-amino-4,6-dideoxygalactose transaminase